MFDSFFVSGTETEPRFEGIETVRVLVIGLSAIGTETEPRFEGIETLSPSRLSILQLTTETEPRFEGIETTGTVRAGNASYGDGDRAPI